MKKIFLFATLLMFGALGTAGAAPMTWDDFIDFDDILIPPTYSYFHDIGDGPDGFSSSWQGGNDTIDSFTVEIAVYDDLVDDTERGKWVWTGWFSGYYETVTVPDGSESGRVTWGLESQALVFADGTPQSYTGDLFGIGAFDISHDGTLNLSVYATDGDFYLDSSRLIVYGDDGMAPVPEPSTMLLMGAGLIGLLGYNRKRFSKK